MEMTASMFSTAWCWAGWLGFLALLCVTLRRAPWRWLGNAERASRLAVFTVAVFALWQLRAVFGDAPPIHLLGATLLTLAVGPACAALSLALVLLASTWRAGAGFAALGMNGLLLVLLPVACSYLWARASERLLPPHVFVYFFVAAFFGAAVSAAVSALAVCGALALAGRVSRMALAENYLPSSVLLIFPEAFLTGGFATLAVVYRPHWLVSFRDRDYLRER